MSYNSQLEGMLTLDIAMNGNVSEGFKTVQNVDSNRRRNSTRLPRDMRQSQAVFEALGFTFTDIGDSVLFEATLPEGWSTKKVHDLSILREYLVDNKGRVRGYYYYNGSFYDRHGNMRLSNRYNVTYQHTAYDNFDSPINVVVKDTDGSIIFNAGQCKEPCSDEYDELVVKAKEYLNSNYPDWEDVTKYWD